jgi:membrane associated rhomboid family serine protease
MFLHANVVHLGLNMWFLCLFGDNVEDRMGPFRFLAFYLICGLLAAGAHIAVGMDPNVPMVGASGAISGVLGAYALMFPRAKIDAVKALFHRKVTTMPAGVYFLVWFAAQLYIGLLSSIKDGAGAGGVAWGAHLGGFVAGCLLFYLFVRHDRWSFRDPGYMPTGEEPVGPRQWPIVGSGADAAHQRYGSAQSRALDDVAPCRDEPGLHQGSGGGDPSGD